MRIVEINMCAIGSTGKIMFQIANRARKSGHMVNTYSTYAPSKKYKKLPDPPEGHKYYGSYLSTMLHYGVARQSMTVKSKNPQSRFPAFFMFHLLSIGLGSSEQRKRASLKREAVIPSPCHQYCNMEKPGLQPSKYGRKGNPFQIEKAPCRFFTPQGANSVRS